MTETEIRNDFDEIARLSGAHGGGHHRYERFLAAHAPSQAASARMIALLRPGGMLVPGPPEPAR